MHPLCIQIGREIFFRLDKLPSHSLEEGISTATVWAHKLDFNISDTKYS